MRLLETSLVSIIVPVYNAGFYLDACLQSIMQQSWQNWELLVIDDGSSDNSVEICDRYAKSDSRITVVHKHNEGVSTARNIGIRMAKGDYIIFADADDLLPSNSIESRMLHRDEAELVIAGFRTVNVTGGISKEIAIENPQIWSQRMAIENVLLSGEIGYQGYLWNKLFRKEIIDSSNLSFDSTIAYNEDRLFCVSYILRCNRITVIRDVVYLYRQTPSGAMAMTGKMKDKDYHKYMSEFFAYDQMIQLIKPHYSDLVFSIAEEAQKRAITLRSSTPPTEQKLKRGFGNRVATYGFTAFRVSGSKETAKQKLRVVYHALKRR